MMDEREIEALRIVLGGSGAGEGGYNPTEGGAGAGSQNTTGCGANFGAVQAALDRFLRELFEGNSRFGLIAREDAADRHRLFVRHILDCLAPWREIAAVVRESGRRRLYDLGSGAGLPGIPLACALGPLLEETVLVERRTKRVNFLRGAVPLVTAAAGKNTATGRTGSSGSAGPPPPPSIRICEADADHLGAAEGDRLSSSIVVFRAFRQTTEDTLRSLSRVFPPETPVCAYKGRHDQTQEEADLIARSGLAVTTGPPRVVPVVVPGLDAERSLLIWYTRKEADR